MTQESHHRAVVAELIWWRPLQAMSPQRVWYGIVDFEMALGRYPQVLHPLPMAATLRDCLFNVFAATPHIWGPSGYPQPADALGSCSSLLGSYPVPRNGEHNSKKTSTIDRVIIPVLWCFLRAQYNQWHMSLIQRSDSLRQLTLIQHICFALPPKMAFNLL